MNHNVSAARGPVVRSAPLPTAISSEFPNGPDLVPMSSALVVGDVFAAGFFREAPHHFSLSPGWRRIHPLRGLDPRPLWRGHRSLRQRCALYPIGRSLLPAVVDRPVGVAPRAEVLPPPRRASDRVSHVKGLKHRAKDPRLERLLPECRNATRSSEPLRKWIASIVSYLSPLRCTLLAQELRWCGTNRAFE